MGKGTTRYFSKEKVQKINKNMKKCSMSLATWEMQIKDTLRFHLTPVRMAIIKKTKNSKWLQGYKDTGDKGTFI
jgi:hypothetical protein